MNNKIKVILSFLIIGLLAFHFSMNKNIRYGAWCGTCPSLRSPNGPFIALASMYHSESNQDAPVYFIISDFDLHYTRENKTPDLGSQASDEEVFFTFKNKKIDIPMPQHSKSFYINFPQVIENNVFVFHKDFTITRLPFTIRTMQQYYQIRDVIFYGGDAIENHIKKIKETLK